MQEARKELQNYMSQYASHPDPIEREARKERMRQTVELGEMEETATQMARTSLENANRQNVRRWPLQKDFQQLSDWEQVHRKLLS